MKRFFLLGMLSCLFCVTAIAGGKDVSLAFLKSEKAIGYVVDWSQMTINGMSKAEWIEKRQVDQPDYDANKEYEEELLPSIEKMFETANDEIKKTGLYFVSSTEKKYTFYFYPQDIKKKGDNNINCVVKETATGETKAEFNLKGNGGTWGSMGNLWGDGFEDAGEKLGKIIKKGIK